MTADAWCLHLMYLEPFGLTKAVLSDYNVLQKYGIINEQEFILKLVSDETLELEFI